MITVSVLKSMKNISKICFGLMLIVFFWKLQEKLTLFDEDTDLSPTYHVAVVSESPNKTLLWCAGSFVSKIHVVTAAHCLERSRNATIILSDQKNEASYKKLQITNIKKHPKWQSNLLLNDIALVELSRTPNLPNLNPIGLASRTKTSRVGTMFGWEKNYTAEPKSVKYKASIISNKECKRYYGSLITKNVFCATGSGCHGSSGGGLVIDGFLVGVMSFGTDQCNIGYPTVYTRVSKYKKWIERQVSLFQNNW